jgi:hypothetical protein
MTPAMTRIFPIVAIVLLLPAIARAQPTERPEAAAIIFILDVVERYARIADDPAAAGIAAVIQAREILRADGPEEAIEFFEEMLEETNLPAVRRAIRFQLVELHRETDQPDQAMDQLRDAAIVLDQTRLTCRRPPLRARETPKVPEHDIGTRIAVAAYENARVAREGALTLVRSGLPQPIDVLVGVGIRQRERLISVPLSIKRRHVHVGQPETLPTSTILLHGSRCQCMGLFDGTTLDARFDVGQGYVPGLGSSQPREHGRDQEPSTRGGNERVNDQRLRGEAIPRPANRAPRLRAPSQWLLYAIKPASFP